MTDDSFGSRLRNLMSNWRTRIEERLHMRSRNSNEYLISVPSTSAGSRSNSADNTSGRLHSDYTELMDGSIPCPSCNGSGLIPKELEGTLVALIPVNDERLKPSKTWLQILFWLCVCIVFGGGLLFLLMPKTVMLSSSGQPIRLVHVSERTNESITFYFTDKLNITSSNYLPVYFENLNAIIIAKFQPWTNDFVGNGSNDTFTAADPLPLYRNTRELLFNNTVTLKGVSS